MKRYHHVVKAIALSALVAVAGRAAATDETGHVAVDLLSETRSVQPGRPFWVGLQMRMEPHWHTYWINPGAAGLETRIDWDLPEGWEAGPIQWPYPEWIPFGEFVSFAYEREVMLLVRITPSPTAATDQDVTITANVTWLECKEICLPGDAQLTVTLPVSNEPAQPNPDQAERFARARDELPLRDTGWILRAQMNDSTIRLTAEPPAWYEGRIRDAVFFPDEPEIIRTTEQTWREEPGFYYVDLKRDTLFGRTPDRLTGVLVSDSGWRGAGTEKALAVDVAIEPFPVGRAMTASDGVRSLAMALLFAFLGGMILNLMPCVFPIISIKILGFVKQAGTDHRGAWAHGLVFSAGVIASFWVLAGLLIALRAGGEQLGWGFQLQSPAFLIFLAALLFVLSLNLFGVFEVGASWIGLGGKAESTGHWTGTFFSGALATIIATPCTAPFMGAALGFALTLSAFEALMVFTCLGIGMAAPYVLLSCNPQWLGFIPKPGPWMETMKQAMGFLMLAAVVWLVWVLSLQAGAMAVSMLAAGLFLMALGAWILGRWGHVARAFRPRVIARSLATLLLIAGIWVPVRHVAARAEADGIVWQTYSAEAVEQALSDGKPVFINFTAAWCLSCLANEAVAFSSASVRGKFHELGIVAFKADWTNRDDAITKALAGYGRNSVPLYVLYGSNADGPSFLPELLTPQIVLESLRKLEIP